MRRRALIKAVAAAAASAACSPPVRAAGAIPLPRVGAPLALGDVPLLDGGMFRASEAEGEVLVIYWWASWCPFCAVQGPYIQALWDAQRASGLKMLGLSVDRRIEDARRHMAAKGYTFPSGWNTPEVEKVLPRPGRALPVTCVRGRDGRVLLAETGEMFPEEVERIARFLSACMPLQNGQILGMKTTPSTQKIRFSGNPTFTKSLKR